MQSLHIFFAALVAISVGAGLLYYQLTRARRHEVMLAFCGVALVASGLAMGRDGVAGTRHFLWMFPHQTATAAAPKSGPYVATAPAATSRLGHE